jgi:hypothetical protein
MLPLGPASHPEVVVADVVTGLLLAVALTRLPLPLLPQSATHDGSCVQAHPHTPPHVSCTL